MNIYSLNLDMKLFNVINGSLIFKQFLFLICIIIDYILITMYVHICFVYPQ